MGVHPKISDRLEAQRGVVGTWQLVADGCTEKQIRHAADQLRSVHDGVLLSGHGPLTDWQRWKAATLTAPNTVLSEWSGGAFVGIRDADRDRFPTTVRRPGSGGAKTYGEDDDQTLGSVRVAYTDRLGPDLIVRDGIETLCPGRIALDLIPKGGRDFADRLVRDALRNGAVEPIDLRVQLARHYRRRGTKLLKELLDEYEPLDLGRARSDAETLALALLQAAGVALPGVNVVVADGEADLVFWDEHLIVELDGPRYHRYLTRDSRKQAKWEQAGWVVRRLPTDDVYDHPHLLLAATTTPLLPAERAIIALTRGPHDVLPRLQAPREQPWRVPLSP